MEFKHPPLKLPELVQALRIPSEEDFQYWYNDLNWQPNEIEDQSYHIDDVFLEQQNSFITNQYNTDSTHFSGDSYQGSNSTPSTLIQYYLAPEEQNVR